MEIKRTNWTNIQLMMMIMMTEIAIKSKQIMHYCQRNQKINHHTVGEKPSLKLVTWTLLGMNSRWFLLKNYPPRQYFKRFIIENLAPQTNIYSVWKSGTCIDLNAQEIESKNRMTVQKISMLIVLRMEWVQNGMNFSDIMYTPLTTQSRKITLHGFSKPNP